MIPAIAGALALTGVVTMGASASRTDRWVAQNSNTKVKQDEPDTAEPKKSEEASKAATGAGVTGVTCAAAAERAGVDRHAEAGLMEQLYAEEFANEIGGTIVEDETSVFAPDDGVDKIIEAPSGQKKIQVKHHSSPAKETTLKKYSDLYGIGASSGFKEGADPADYGTKVLTVDDLSWKKKGRLRWDRIKRGMKKTTSWGNKPIKGITGRIVNATKSAVGQVAAIMKSPVSWFLRLSLGKQILVVAVSAIIISGVIYVMRKRYR